MKEANLREFFGSLGAGTGGKNASATKKGPGRKASHGEPGNRLNKAKPGRAYRAWMAYFASKRVARKAK